MEQSKLKTHGKCFQYHRVNRFDCFYLTKSWSWLTFSSFRKHLCCIFEASVFWINFSAQTCECIMYDLLYIRL